MDSFVGDGFSSRKHSSIVKKHQKQQRPTRSNNQAQAQTQSKSSYTKGENKQFFTKSNSGSRSSAFSHSEKNTSAEVINPYQNARGFKQSLTNADTRFAQKTKGHYKSKANTNTQARSSTGVKRQVIDVHHIFESSVAIGKMIELPVVSLTEQGAFINANEHGELFVPKSQLRDGLQVGDLLRVFLYKDSGRVQATARHPYIELGMTGRLKITSINNGTAYLDFGIPKELVVPISEQRGSFRVGGEALVLVSIDEQGRLFGTQCFNRYIRDVAEQGEFKTNEKVRIVAVSHTPLGFRVIVNDSVYGLIYKSEQKGELQIGKRYDGFVKMIRPDGRLDVSLQEQGREGVEHAADEIFQALFYSRGHFDFTDKADPEEIEYYLHMSKSKFKKAIGYLYKARLIIIKEQGIELTMSGFNKAQELFTEATQDMFEKALQVAKQNQDDA